MKKPHELIEGIARSLNLLRPVHGRRIMPRLVLCLFMSWLAPVTVRAEPRMDEFASNVVRHVLIHELAHALIREFGLPVLANEEAMADSFATIWITQTLQAQAPAIVSARIRSWLYENGEVKPEDYDFKGEHLLDIRRAYQAGCLLHGADPSEWSAHVQWLKFSQDDLADCSDTAPDQIEGWKSILAPHLLPEGKISANVAVIYGEGPMKDDMMASGLMEDFAETVRRFNWKDRITIHFDHCARGAYWNRSRRVITLCDAYVRRFIEQGKKIQTSQ